MAFKAQEDTVAYEAVGPDTFVRRQVFAGQEVPSGWFKDEEGKQPFGEGEKDREPYGPAAGYPHQLDDGGKLLDEHAEHPSEFEARARSAGGVVALTEQQEGGGESTSGADTPTPTTDQTSASKSGKS
jgi:hypothetical protein